MRNLIIFLTLFFGNFFVYSKNISIFVSRTEIQYVLSHPNIKYKDIVIAQIIEETGYLTSKKFRTKNNVFGMKVSNRGYCLNSKNRGQYAVYTDFKHSVDDYAEYQQKKIVKYKLYNKKLYLKYLSKYYAKNKNYVRNLNNIIKKIQNHVKEQQNKNERNSGGEPRTIGDSTTVGSE